jgi:prepilin-type N-terminal cleavage/methylation domain-containing protein
VKTKRPVTCGQWQVAGASSRGFRLVTRHSSLVTRSAFTLVEVLIVVTLLSLIVVALMGVFTSTQKAFRASLTQTDVLESGRAAMDLITGDLKAMSPSLDYSNGAVNFYANTNLNYAPLFQTLIASVQSRTNVLETFFILSRANQTWTGTGYVVDTSPTSGVNPLYRFSMSTNVAAANPGWLLYFFTNAVANNNFSGMSRLMDGVVTLRLHAYDNNGYWMTNTYSFAGGQIITNKNVQFLLPSALGEIGIKMFSNALPPVVEVEMATLEDRTLQRAEARPVGAVRDQYLQAQAANVHVFRQRVAVPNANSAAYQ